MFLKKAYIKLIWLALIGLFLNNCHAQTDIRSSIRQCVKDKTDKHFQDLYSESTLDVYLMVDSIESSLRSADILKDLSKKEYLRLVEGVKKSDSALIENNTIKEFSTISGLVVSDIVSFCPYKTVVEQENEIESSLVNQFRLSQRLLATGYEFSLIKEYIVDIASKDFEAVEYRTPIMIMLLFHLENKILERTR